MTKSVEIKERPLPPYEVELEKLRRGAVTWTRRVAHDICTDEVWVRWDAKAFHPSGELVHMSVTEDARDDRRALAGSVSALRRTIRAAKRGEIQPPKFETLEWT